MIRRRGTTHITHQYIMYINIVLIQEIISNIKIIIEKNYA